MKIRIIAVLMLALSIGIGSFVAVPAQAQVNGNLQVAQFYGVVVPATDLQLLRVTLGNSHMPVPRDSPHWRESSFTIELDGPATPVTIGPGESFTYTLDPREVGVLVDQNTGLRHVRVSGRITAVAVDPSDLNAPVPVLLVELLNRRTGKLESFHSFPGFTGGVYVAAGDVN